MLWKAHSLLALKGSYKDWQQIDFCNHSEIVTECRCLGGRCEACGKILYPVVPKDIYQAVPKDIYPAVPKDIYQAGLFGAGMQALTACLKIQCHLSVKTIKTFYQDVFDISVSTGYLCKVLKNLSKSLDLPCDELVHELPSQSLVNADETGGKTNGARRWIGGLGCLCLLFSKEEAKFFARCWKKMFEILHSSDSRKWQKTKKKLLPIVKQIKTMATTKVSNHWKCWNMCKRFREYGDCYCQFVENQQVP
ncbi:MAG: transposase [Planctomycetia bacterium]|nr:transposase [Planctomycetia bacterium]